jgi:hypothetical protein
MKGGAIGSYILLLTLVFSVMSTVVQATEYREIGKEVQAADILNHIEKGDDVNLTNCHIVGELNLSRIKLETVPNPSTHIKSIISVHNKASDLYPYAISPKVRYGVFYSNKQKNDLHRIKENLSITKSNVSIEGSAFENNLDLSNAI